MGRKLKETIDYEKEVQFRYPLWLTGVLEIGGGMFFERKKIRKNGHEIPYALPVISVSDHDENRMNIMRDIIGGRIKPGSTATIAVLAQADQAAWLAYSIKPYAPSRQTMIGAFLDWANAEFTEDRVDLANKFRGRKVLDPVTIADYASLVTQSDFIRGVIDGRAGINHKEQMSTDGITSWIHNQMNIYSHNRSLLDALRQQYGGEIFERNRVGEIAWVRGAEYQIKHDSLCWTIGKYQTNDLIAWVKPFLPISNA